MALHGNGRKLRLAYFGSYPPEGSGLRFEKVPPNGLMADPSPGLYAVSAHLVAHLPVEWEQTAPGAGWWMRRIAPVAIVGHAFYIYDVR